MKWIKFFISLEGRIGRKTFWLTSIVAIAVQLVVIVISGVLLAALTMDDGPIRVGNEGSWLTTVPTIALFYPKFVIDAKRGHDRNIPLWVIGSFYACVAVRELLVSFGWLTIFPNQNVISATNVVVRGDAAAGDCGPCSLCRSRISQRHARPEPVRARPAGQGLRRA